MENLYLVKKVHSYVLDPSNIMHGYEDCNDTWYEQDKTTKIWFEL